MPARQNLSSICGISCPSVSSAARKLGKGISFPVIGFCPRASTKTLNLCVWPSAMITGHGNGDSAHHPSTTPVPTRDLHPRAPKVYGSIPAAPRRNCPQKPVSKLCRTDSGPVRFGEARFFALFVHSQQSRSRRQNFPYGKGFLIEPVACGKGKY